MSHDSRIELTVGLQNYSIYDSLLTLLASGWSLDDYGHISILPLGDNGDFNWVRMKASEQDRALEVIKQKTRSGEVVGIALTWKKTNVGAHVVFSQINNISFSLIINRKRLKDSEFTDVSWYLEKILPPLIFNGIVLEHVSWNEYA